MEGAVPQVSVRQVPLWGWLLLATMIVVLYAVGYDQGFPVLSKAGSSYLHELFHDGRHLLGIPCH
jgi:hypothetical protein